MPAHTCRAGGALAGFLKELLMQDVPYAHRLERDFAECLAIHFQVRLRTEETTGCTGCTVSRPAAVCHDG